MCLKINISKEQKLKPPCKGALTFVATQVYPDAAIYCKLQNNAVFEDGNLPEAFFFRLGLLAGGYLQYQCH